MEKENKTWITNGVCLKKSFDGYRVIYPYKNEDGSLNWRNIILGGNWWKFIKVMLVILVILVACYSYARDTRVCRELISDPCQVCIDVGGFIDYSPVTSGFEVPNDYVLKGGLEDGNR